MHNGSRIILWIYLCLNWLFLERKKTSRGKVEETPCFYIKEKPKMFLLFFLFLKNTKKKNIQQLKEKRKRTREGSSALCYSTPSRLHPKSEWRWETRENSREGGYYIKVFPETRITKDTPRKHYSPHPLSLVLSTCFFFSNFCLVPAMVTPLRFLMSSGKKADKETRERLTMPILYT